MSQTNHRLTELDPISRQDFLNEVKNTLIEYRFNLDIPKNITYGVEIEAQGPIMAPLSSDEYLIQPLEEYAQLNRHRGIDFEYCPWLLKKDSSFVKAHIEGAEVASPILTNISDDWEMLEYVCRQIKAAGGYIGAYSGGHIHFGEDDFFKTHEPLDLIKVLKTWAAFEPIIYRFGAGEYLNYRTTMYEYASYLSRDIKRYFSNLYDYENYSYLDILDKLGFTNCRGLKFSHLRDYYIEKEKPIEFKQTLEIRSPNGTLEPAI